MDTSFEKKQAHDLAIIWTKSEWERKTKGFTSDEITSLDEGCRMEEFFRVYKNAFDYFSNLK